MTTEAGKAVLEALGPFPAISPEKAPGAAPHRRHEPGPGSLVAADLKDRGWTLAQIGDAVGLRDVEATRRAIKAGVSVSGGLEGAAEAADTLGASG